MNEKLVKLQSRLDKIDAKLEKIEKLMNKLDAIEHKVSYTDLALMKINGNIVNSGNDIKETRRHIHNLTLMLKLQGIGATNDNTPTDMFQQPTYGSSPYGNASMYKPTCNYRSGALKAEHTQPFDPFKPYNPFLQDGYLSVKDACKRFEELNKLAQEQEQQTQEEQAISNNNYCSNSETYDVRKIKLEDWDKRIEKLGIKITRPTSADNTFLIMDSKYYRDITTRDSNYPNKNLRDGYAWYPELLMDPKTKTYLWSIARIIPTDKE